MDRLSLLKKLHQSGPASYGLWVDGAYNRKERLILMVLFGFGRAYPTTRFATKRAVDVYRRYSY